MNEETAGVLTKDVIFSGGAVLLQVGPFEVSTWYGIHFSITI